ncbi:MAG: Fur family transcriptional regulator, ferric uptake regulator [Patescibacteria group bacterium]|nr:Fur family transcriptional regulator, ferric uptake regulator [Patescibacteria group bacterium]
MLSYVKKLRLIMKNAKDNQFAIATLTEHGLKVTKARTAVFSHFLKENAPMSVQEIAAMLPEGIADQVTVYRIIEAFEKKGIVRKVNLRHNHDDYELAHAEDHHHIVCIQCGRIEEFFDCHINKITKTILAKSKSFRIVSDHALELFGQCNRCAVK